jgi:ribosomal protein L16 Arg81 hydroxylase
MMAQSSNKLRRQEETATFRQNREILQDRGPSFATRRRHSRGAAAANNNSYTKNTSTTVSEAAAIQQSLNRTQLLLKHELERVAHVASTIDDDGKHLQETMHSHQTMNVSSAKKALTSLERAQQREQRILIASLVFFWSVVFYIFLWRVLLHLPFADRILLLIPW